MADPHFAEAVGRRRWYHTLELGQGVVTPGEYDLRPVVGRLPIPSDLTDRRCLDVGSRDGFYAFTMEARGAEVVSLDIDEPEDIHFPGARPPREAVQRELDDGNGAFFAASAALGSSVTRRCQTVYALDSADVGHFDFAVIAALLLHLRDPVEALAAIRGVLRPGGRLLINDVVVPGIDAVRRRPVAEFVGVGGPFWWLPNRAGLERWATAAGFEITARGRPYLVPYGSGKDVEPLRESLRSALPDLPGRLLLRRGAPHVWVLASNPGA